MNENTFSEQNAPSRGKIVLYQTADGRTSIDVKLENETVWLSKEQMAVLFERDRTVISRHVNYPKAKDFWASGFAGGCLPK